MDFNFFDTLLWIFSFFYTYVISSISHYRIGWPHCQCLNVLSKLLLWLLFLRGSSNIFSMTLVYKQGNPSLNYFLLYSHSYSTLPCIQSSMSLLSFNYHVSQRFGVFFLFPHLSSNACSNSNFSTNNILVSRCKCNI